MKKQEELGWDETLTTLATLKDPFDVAAGADTTILARYSATAALLAARSDAGQRGAATREANKKAAAPKTPPPAK